jgi:hypothetical protein
VWRRKEYNTLYVLPHLQVVGILACEDVCSLKHNTTQ